MRLVLFVDVMVTVILWAPFVRTLWHVRPWWIPGVFVGIGGTFVYALIGQEKGYRLDIPFDAVSWLGLIFFTVLNVFLVITILREPDRERG